MSISAICRLFICAICVSFIMGCPVKMAYAAPDEPLYFVQGVKADKTASSAAVAREKAVNDARKKAYDVVLGRIVLTEEKNKIPNPSNLELVNFVSEMAVMNEKTSSVRYMADLDFRFNSGAIKDYLEKNNIGYVKLFKRYKKREFGCAFGLSCGR